MNLINEVMGMCYRQGILFAKFISHFSKRLAQMIPKSCPGLLASRCLVYWHQSWLSNKPAISQILAFFHLDWKSTLTEKYLYSPTSEETTRREPLLSHKAARAFDAMLT